MTGVQTCALPISRTLREHRKVTDALVTKHEGRLVKTTGDGVLLEFPSSLSPLG